MFGQWTAGDGERRPEQIVDQRRGVAGVAAPLQGCPRVGRQDAGVIVARNCRAVREGIELVTARPRSPEKVAAAVDEFSWAANGRALAAYYDTLV